MKQFKSTFSIEFPLLCGIMSQWHYKFLVSLIPKLHVLPNFGLSNIICKPNQVMKSPTNTAGNELSLVMTRLGLQHSEGEDSLGDQGLSMDEIEGLFVEEEPSLGEIKQAFDVFDQNGDGFIDAFELNGVLSSLGLLKSELDEEVCRRILGGFDRKGVGLVDIHDFVRLLEKGFVSPN